MPLEGTAVVAGGLGVESEVQQLTFGRMLDQTGDVGGQSGLVRCGLVTLVDSSEESSVCVVGTCGVGSSR